MYPTCDCSRLVHMIIWFEWDVKIIFDGIVWQMKKNRFWKIFKLVDTKQDNCMRIMNIDCVILLKGWWWTVSFPVLKHRGSPFDGWCRRRSTPCTQQLPMSKYQLDQYVFRLLTLYVLCHLTLFSCFLLYLIVWLPFSANLYPICNCKITYVVLLYFREY